MRRIKEGIDRERWGQQLHEFAIKLRGFQSVAGCDAPKMLAELASEADLLAGELTERYIDWGGTCLEDGITDGGNS